MKAIVVVGLLCCWAALGGAVTCIGQHKDRVTGVVTTWDFSTLSHDPQTQKDNLVMLDGNKRFAFNFCAPTTVECNKSAVCHYDDDLEPWFRESMGNYLTQTFTPTKDGVVVSFTDGTPCESWHCEGMKKSTKFTLVCVPELGRPLIINSWGVSNECNYTFGGYSPAACPVSGSGSSASRH